MGKSLKYLADNLIISRDCDRRQLNLSQPEARPLRERDVILASMCEVHEQCEVERRNPSVHVLIFSLDGNARLFTKDCVRKGCLIEPGQVVILPAHHPHYYRMEDNSWKAIWIYLADSDTWRQIRELAPVVRKSITCDELLRAIEGFWSESLRNESRAKLAARHYAEVAVLNIERELDTDESLSNRQMRQKLYILWDKVSANLAHEWTVAELADEVGISPQHLYRVSAQLCGHKPMEMVKLLRMRQAQELLINTGYMVKEIARAIGYSDAFSFSAAFKKYAGCSPRVFRDKNTGKDEEERKPNWKFLKQKKRSKK